MAKSRLRFGQTGPVSNAGTPDQVLAAKGKPLPEFADPTSPGGSITPLTGVAVGDSQGTADVATGAFSGDKAFEGLGALQSCIDALAETGGGCVPLAPGSYAGEDVPITIVGQVLTIKGFASRGATGAAGVTISGNVELDASDTECELTLETLSGAANISDGDTGASCVLARAVCGSIALTGALRAEDSIASAGVVAGAGRLVGSRFSAGLHLLEVEDSDAELDGCTVLGQLRIDGSGSIVNSEVASSADTCLLLTPADGELNLSGDRFAGSVQFGDGLFNCWGCTFKKSLATTSDGVLRLFNAVFDTTGGGFSVASAHLFMDASSELEAHVKGVDVSVAIHALSLGQGGNSSFFETTATYTFTDTPGDIARVHTARAITIGQVLTLDPTGALGKGGFYFDMWATDNPVQVKVGATNIGPNGGDPIPVVLEGHGVRHLFQASDDSTTVSYTGSVKLA